MPYSKPLEVHDKFPKLSKEDKNTSYIFAPSVCFWSVLLKLKWLVKINAQIYIHFGSHLRLMLLKLNSGLLKGFHLKMYLKDSFFSKYMLKNKSQMLQTKLETILGAS